MPRSNPNLERPKSAAGRGVPFLAVLAVLLCLAAASYVQAAGDGNDNGADSGLATSAVGEGLRIL